MPQGSDLVHCTEPRHTDLPDKASNGQGLSLTVIDCAWDVGDKTYMMSRISFCITLRMRSLCTAYPAATASTVATADDSGNRPGADLAVLQAQLCHVDILQPMHGISILKQARQLSCTSWPLHASICYIFWQDLAYMATNDLKFPKIMVCPVVPAWWTSPVLQ